MLPPPRPDPAAKSSLPLDEESPEAGWEISHVSFKHTRDLIDISGEEVKNG
jgi:hypothetical protein